MSRACSGTMKEINDSSRRIVGIIAVIVAIAFQTAILALNFAVETALAGGGQRLYRCRFQSA